MRISDWSSDVCSSDLEAELLSAANGVVLRIGDRIETKVPGRIVFDSVPAGLAARPVLSATVVSEAAGEAVLDLGYLTGGLDWQADYVGRLDGRSEEHTSELQSLMRISYAVFCLKK